MIRHLKFIPAAVAFLTLLLLLVTCFPFKSVHAAEAIHYRYSTADNNVYDYWISATGIKINSARSRNRTLVYRAVSDEIITLDHESREAVVLGRNEIKQLIRKIDSIYRRLQNLPPHQRKMMERAIGGSVENVKDTDAITTPEFVDATPTTWRGRSAKLGVLSTGDDTAGQAIVLDEPPLSVSSEERRTFEQFKQFFVDILRISQSLSESLDVTQALNDSQGLLGELQFRLAEYRSENETLRLTEWSRESTSEDFLSIPEDYSVRKPHFGTSGELGPRTPRSSRGGG